MIKMSFEGGGEESFKIAAAAGEGESYNCFMSYFA